VRDLLLRAKHLFVAAMVAGCGVTWLNEGGRIGCEVPAARVISSASAERPGAAVRSRARPKGCGEAAEGGQLRIRRIAAGTRKLLPGVAFISAPVAVALRRWRCRPGAAAEPSDEGRR